MSLDLETLQAAIARLKQDTAAIRKENARIAQATGEIEAQFRHERRRFRIQASLALAAVALALLLSPASRSAYAEGNTSFQDFLNRLASAENRLTRVEALTVGFDEKSQYITIVDGEMYITGTNLHILNGMGATNGYPADPSSTDKAYTHVNGKGNLIIGYNEANEFNGKKHAGSHNLIVGAYQNYTSFGGIIAGAYNQIFGPYASVVGGANNTAGGAFAIVSGGRSGNALGDYSSVCGGAFNLADGFASSVSGGHSNFAAQAYSSISGGYLNTATGMGASISGGASNAAAGDYSSISGGHGIYVSDTYDWAGGTLH